ncbi:MAG: hydroxymethylglutaryl-CoA lyase [Candidatus Marinimicrobia bacterium]|nr:hydroxymethylglutaryl-CoA lyase [Candidatus Neomarinimicrobiota bacterium]MBL7010340.1 hydroxymethylglutaryl-CoA lyase [Candidatus Neomarinimicrobiota bacterium]MBL7030032.1 hydroxymethylglutaryl-CoA lyase [Candidatus Neomarinimicrobiota bacterium]
MIEPVRIVEVGPRDGLQNISQPISSTEKKKYIDMLTEAGCPEIEVTSFVSPKWVPQLADAKEVSASIQRNNDTTYTALIPNRKGLEAAIENGYYSVAIFTAASETFSKNNTNSSIEENFKRFEEMIPIWEEKNLRVRAYISTCWVCPYEGDIGAEAVIKVIQDLIDLGVHEISLGDTIGKATPDDVEYLLEIILDNWPREIFALHMHDTYNMAAENLTIGLGMGIRILDSSAGGVGGCPFAPGASGNISTESAIRICKEQGFETGIDSDKLRLAGAYIQSIIQE